MTDRQRIKFADVALLFVGATLFTYIVLTLWRGTWFWPSPTPTPHHCHQCEIAYSRGLFHGIDYAERGVARLADQDGHRYIVWTGDAFGRK